MELIVFVGIPASGKSTESEKYRAKGYQIVSSDAIRSKIIGRKSLANFSAKEQSKINRTVFETVYAKTEEALSRGESVVVDATHLIRRFRVEFLKHFETYPCTKKCVLFLTPFEICLMRNRKRTGAAFVPEDVMLHMLFGFECPDYAEGWDEIVPVTPDAPYEPDSEKEDFDRGTVYRKLTEKCCGRKFSPEEFRAVLEQLGHPAQ